MKRYTRKDIFLCSSQAATSEMDGLQRIYDCLQETAHIDSFRYLKMRIALIEASFFENARTPPTASKLEMGKKNVIIGDRISTGRHE